MEINFRIDCGDLEISAPLWNIVPSDDESWSNPAFGCRLGLGSLFGT